MINFPPPQTIGFGASAAIAGYVWDEKRAIKMWCHVKKDFVLYKFKAHERQTCGARPDHHFTILLCHLEQIVSPGCIPLAVETYGNWGKEAHDTFSRLASYLAIHQTSPKSAVVAKLYGRLNIALAVGQYHFQGYRETSHSMVTKRIKNSIRAEWAHGPTSLPLPIGPL
eukprot:Em0090g8a